MPHQMEQTDHDNTLRPAEQGEVLGFERVQNRACDQVVWLSGYSHAYTCYSHRYVWVLFDIYEILAKWCKLKFC